MLSQPPLNLPRIEAVVPNNEYRLRLRVDDGDKRRTIPASLASLGEQQVISLLGAVLFSGRRCVALEEPEAHLHAPTTGRALREVLRNLVRDVDLDQLFVATHSNLFDLDNTGFWSVFRDATGTVAIRENELGKIDADHLFEPGPAKRVLQDILRLGDPEQVVASGADGAPITAREMLTHLQEDTALGVKYASELSRAAARMFVREKPKLGEG